MDRLTPEQRHKNMSNIKNRDSEIELKLRKALWQDGLRGYRKNYSGVPGHPDIVFTRWKLAIFVDSEFFHGYNWVERKHDFKSNQEFWIPKIERNMERDHEVNVQLQDMGWTVLRFWGKEVKKNTGDCVELIRSTLQQLGEEHGI